MISSFAIQIIRIEVEISNYYYVVEVGRYVLFYYEQKLKSVHRIHIPLKYNECVCVYARDAFSCACKSKMKHGPVCISYYNQSGVHYLIIKYDVKHGEVGTTYQSWNAGWSVFTFHL